MNNTPWLKVTHIGCMPGTSQVSRWPRKGYATHPGRWVVFDKNKNDGSCAAHALADFDTFEQAAAACHAMREGGD